MSTQNETNVKKYEIEKIERMKNYRIQWYDKKTYGVNKNEMKILEEWTKMKFQTIIFDTNRKGNELKILILIYLIIIH